MNTLSVKTAYQIGLQLKIGLPLRSLREKMRCCLRFLRHPVYALRCLSPIDYVRYREFEFAFHAISAYSSLRRRMLDISSPKLLPLTIAYSSPSTQVYATDILSGEVKWAKKSAETLNLSNMVFEQQDAREISYPNAFFDVVSSISVFEHIAPEKDGELPAVTELGRILAPNGIAVITVPFAHKYFAEYRTGQVYERSSEEGKSLFFQRFYDYDLLIKNIVQASGLTAVDIRFIEERYFFKDPHKRLAHYINGSRKKTLLFGILFPLLSHIFLSKPQLLEHCRKPYIACIVLKKT